MGVRNVLYLCFENMPKIYNYFGIVFLFHTNEHYPIHVHATYGNYQTVFELVMKNGKVIDVVRRRKYSNELPPTQLKQAAKFVWARKEQIAKKWIEALVHNKKVTMEKVTRKISS